MRPLEFPIRGQDRSGPAFQSVRRNVRLTEGSFGRLERSAGRVTERIGRIRSAVTGLAVGVGAAAAGLTALSRRAANSAEDIVDTAAQVNTGIERLQELRLGFDQNGGSAGQLDDALLRLNRRLAVFAQTGKGSAAPAIRELDIEVTDAAGNARDSGEVFTEVAEKFRNLETDANAAALASQLFGDRVGPKLVPFLQQGEEGIAAVAQRAREAGAIMDQETARGAAKASAEMRLFGKIAGAQLTAALAKTAPALAEITGAIAQMIPPIVEATERFLRFLGVIDTPIQERLVGLRAERAGLLGQIDAFREFDGNTVARAGQTGLDSVGFKNAVERQRDLRRQIQELEVEISNRQRAREGARRAALAPVNVPAVSVPTVNVPRVGTSGGGGRRARRAIEETSTTAATLSDNLRLVEQAVDGLNASTIGSIEPVTRLGGGLRAVADDAAITADSVSSLTSGLISAATQAGTTREKLLRLFDVVAQSDAFQGLLSQGFRSLFGGGGFLGSGLQFAGAGGGASSTLSFGSLSFTPTPFARGGVVRGASFFTDADGGFGVAGERPGTPEAILPLERDGSGNLGVRAQSGPPPVFQIITRDPETQVRMRPSAASQARDLRKFSGMGGAYA